MPINQICLATTNAGKLAEFRNYLQSFPFDISMLDNNYPDVEETGSSFIENALIKAKTAAEYHQMPILADDSGICVPALKGDPGIYSARYAGVNATADNNIDLLLENMRHLSGDERKAYFYGVLVLLRHANDPCPIVIAKQWDGIILTERKPNNHGFGYDPIFYIPELNCTAAELTQAEKNKVSHRGKALTQLMQELALDISFIK